MASITSFLDTSGFPARWHCGEGWLLNPWLGWLHIISDLVIFAAYMAIPLVIVAYMRHRREVPFPSVFWIFGAFIFSCGTTHLLDAIIFWHPIYPVAGLVKALTAIVSVAAVILTIRIMPLALALPGVTAMNQRLQREVAARTASEGELAIKAAELAHSQRRLVAAQQVARLGDWTYDLRTQNMEWSDEVYRLFERDPALGPPRTFAENADLYVDPSVITLAIHHARSKPGEAIEIDLEARLPSGVLAWHRSIVRTITDEHGEITQVWGTVQDVTREKQASLADARQRQDLQRINQQLEQFAYIASHDLTEPLRKVRFFSDVLKDETEGTRSPAADDAIARMTSATERMNRLVQDLLAFARSGKSLANPGVIPLDAALDEALETLDERIKERHAVIEREPLPSIWGEQGMLAQVFQNLVMNALKYSHPERTPRIRIAAATSATQVIITISDNGLGFALSQIGRIFEPFVRLHRSIGQDGTGIGLAICRRIIEVHGGSIEAQPGLGMGAIFTIRLPRHFQGPTP